MRKLLPLALTLVLLCASLAGCAVKADPYQKFSTSFFGTFDTIVFVIGYAEEQAVFDRVAQEVQERFERLHKVYDGYNAYEGVANLYALNRNAANGPMKVEPELMDLLLYCKEKQPQLWGKVNVAMGAMLSIWHDYREAGEFDPETAELPPMEALQAAAQHMNLDDVILDEAAGTVYFADPKLKLDLGSVAKGYAAEQVAQWMLTSEMPSFILSAGGNIRVGNPPLDDRLRWGVSVQDPDKLALGIPSEDYLDVLYVANASVVTSGDYQRYYVVDGKRYHHLIDPDTLMPGESFRAVTVVTEDSGFADLLSTALFLLPYEESRAFAESLPGVEVLWILPDDTVEMTDGLRQMSFNNGASSRE